MRPEIRRLHTPDAASFDSFAPQDPQDFSMLVQVLVGPAEGEGEESFDIEVITPKHLAARVERAGPISGRHLLVVARFDAATIQSWIENAVAECSGADWKDIAAKLSRLGRWEFEDYDE